jgi:hypothetical protein
VSDKPQHNWPNYDHVDRERPLSDEEIVQIRQVLLDAERSKWLFSQAQRWAAWIAGILIAITVGYDSLKKFIMALMRSS